MEPGDRNATRAPAPGHGATVMAGHSGPQIHLLLSHGPPPRRIRELVPGAHGRAPAPDARARHGGRRYADDVKQIITGSIGFDDWEWGVDLFAEDPLVFKKLIYEMRFDEVS